jgi:GH24 family phage-related lysozyme (muramidase)
VIWPVVRSSFVAFSTRFEGAIPWLYLDVRGLVTTAIGVLVDPVELAFPLPLKWPDGKPATRTQIAAEWWTIKREGSLAHRGAQAAGKVAVLRLTPEDVEALTLAKLDTMVRHLERRFPGFETWPAPAQLGVLSMAWAMGPGFTTHPKWDAACRALDFTGAAEECAISTVGNAGVAPRNVANRALFLEAADALAQGQEPDVLLYRA